VYKVSKNIPAGESAEQIPQFRVENSSNDDFPLLAELGVRNSSVMLANCTIWVEGITDRLYIRKYLKLFQKEFRQYMEDIHYSFVEYGGANLPHWSFSDDESEGIDVKRLCGRVLLIADRDDDDKKMHADLASHLGERFFQLPCREIENLLTPAIISAVIRKDCGDAIDLKPFDHSQYFDQYLGRFIDKQVLPDNWKAIRGRKSEHPYGGESGSGTIVTKVPFCRKAIDNIKELKDLSKDALQLCERIYKFIEENNP